MYEVGPYLTFPGNCREAIEFYRSALEAEVLFVQLMGDSPMPEMGPAENVMHCTLQVGDSRIMMSDDPSGQVSRGAGMVSLAIGLNDVEHARSVFERLADGGAVMMPLGKTYWAEAFGMVTDRFGIRWMVNCEAKSD